MLRKPRVNYFEAYGLDTYYNRIHKIRNLAMYHDKYMDSTILYTTIL